MEETAENMFLHLKYNMEELFSFGNNYKAISFSRTLKGNKTRITFNILEECITIDGNISMKELQAINKKCKELGWLDE